MKELYEIIIATVCSDLGGDSRDSEGRHGRYPIVR